MEWIYPSDVHKHFGASVNVVAIVDEIIPARKTSRDFYQRIYVRDHTGARLHIMLFMNALTKFPTLEPENVALFLNVKAEQFRNIEQCISTQHFGCYVVEPTKDKVSRECGTRLPHSS